MSYHSLAKANERYQLTVLWVFMAAFLVALGMMMIHPTVALILFGVSLVGLGAFCISERFITAALQRSAKQSLHHHACPECGATVKRDSSDAKNWCCDRCGAAFEDSGRQEF